MELSRVGDASFCEMAEVGLSSVKKFIFYGQTRKRWGLRGREWSAFEELDGVV